jgi:uncharacterized protein (TIGR00297 family)
LLDIIQILIGGLLGILIAYLAWRVRSLSASGARAAALMGALIFGLGGFSWAALLMVFFISSSLLSRLFKAQKAALNEKFAKGSQRDWAQVFANGGLGVILVLLSTWRPDIAWIWWSYAGAMAAVNADTWATELGVLSPRPPRLLTTGRIVEHGESGGVTLLGTLSALGGAGSVAAFAVWFSPSDTGWAFFAVVLLAGLLGSLIDSLLGTTVQALYRCPTCQRVTERHPLHGCGTSTVYYRGWRWLNNDWVNFFCALSGALMAMLGWWILI